jgi:parvulin-like peptidyl-prolyl isomerase
MTETPDTSNQEEISKKTASSRKKEAKQERKEKIAAIHARRSLSKKQRERQRQRRVIISVGAAVGLALLIVLGGILYDQVWYPSQTVAQVNDTTLSRRGYWEQERLSLAQRIIQNFELLELFRDNEQIRNQLAGQTPGLNLQAEAVPDEPVNQTTIDEWQNEQLMQQEAAELGVQVSDAEVNQALVRNLGSTFLPAPVVTPTDTLTGTDSLTGSDSLNDTAAQEEAPEENLLPPTATPFPTPPPEAAAEQVPDIIDLLYQRYTDDLELSGLEPAFSEAEFRQALEQQYRRQVYERKIKESLVPEETFTPSDEPQNVSARHILLSVETPEDAGEEARDEAYEQQLEEAEELVEELRDGADFAELAAEYSDDPGSKDQGGDVGSFDREGMTASGSQFVPEFVDAAFALEEGEISDPVRTQFGWHIIEVTSRNIPDEATQLQNARDEAFEEWLETQRQENTLQRFPEPTATPTVPPTPEGQPTLEPTFVPGPPTPLPTPTLTEGVPELPGPQVPENDVPESEESQGTDETESP